MDFSANVDSSHRESERRQATIMFADIARFTTMAEGERLEAKLEGYLERAREMLEQMNLREDLKDLEKARS